MTADHLSAPAPQGQTVAAPPTRRSLAEQMGTLGTVAVPSPAPAPLQAPAAFAGVPAAGSAYAPAPQASAPISAPAPLAGTMYTGPAPVAGSGPVHSAPAPGPAQQWTAPAPTAQTPHPSSGGLRWGGPRQEPAPAPRVRVIDDPAAQGLGTPPQGQSTDRAPEAQVAQSSNPAGPAAPPARAGGRAASAPGRLGMNQEREANDVELDAVLREMVQAGASDLHLTVGSVPMMRRNGSLVPLEGQSVLDGDGLRRSLYGILTQRQREKFETNLELDFSYSVRGLARFRVNYFQQRDSIGAAMRLIPYEIKPLEDLGVPGVVANFAGLPRGLVLVTGPTGSGKSTTLAALVDLANRTRSDHIMTVEDPIEFLHDHKKSIINQREVGADTHSFANALKHVLRQDPDIILVGEMRDLETISVALTAAETGHLVFATLHTQDAAQTVDRIIDVFPAEQQEQVRVQLAGALQGVVCQTLCKRTGRPGRIVATEVLVATPAIRNLVREGKTHQIYSAMQAGQQLGMHTLDQHLADLVRTGQISYETGLEKCHHVEDYNKLTGRQARMNQGGAALQQAATNIGGF
ncbi:PilT/PilU family type 4a pilus ATPase [Sanguibacter sp. 4.1]|uniref:PilT/PilU family type 4a pilus ATPase n=1 Tax=Sanguibacter biliveldensis TaxID=3030830 RepID=A0AAF0ZB59_9MICO|nr:PilT/PilU family type 4a pilus ATPase [Sanguibacter sp. 4.1]WPF84006.1 PilT/PilU family type 4a pilus ATPase [Sanguibacter sp. 4.1]